MNKRLILAKRPVGMPEPDTWRLETAPIPEIGEGQMLVRQHYISLDPAMRGWMRDAKSYAPPIQIGELMRSASVGEVMASNLAGYQAGDFVSGWGGVQQYAVFDGSRCFKVNPSLVPLPVYIGTLGMPGMTSYFGILEVGKIKEGETVLVSGGAGAVGSVVGQIAKVKGCKVVGIAGGPEKCAYMTDELGFDAAIDYKNENIYAGIQRTLPEGIDVYFDNVGGEILDAALANIRMHARIVICGAISQYNNRDDVRGPKNYLSLLVNRATMQGMLVMDYAKDFAKAGQEMGMWMAQGKLKTREDIYEGIENFHTTFTRLFTGDKKGKLVLKVIED